MLLSLTETAEAFSVSEPTLRGWIKSGCPVVQEGFAGRAYQLDLVRVREWRDGVLSAERAEVQERQKQIAAAQNQLDLIGGEAEGVDALPTKIRREYYEAETRRIALARTRGELVVRADMLAEVERAFSYLADRLQALPDDLERSANLPPEATARCVEAVDGYQAELASFMRRWGADAGLRTS